MSKKIKITESQLKVLMENKNKVVVSEQSSSPTPPSAPVQGQGFETSDELVNSISQRLSEAISNRDWSLVEQVAGDVQKFTTREDTSKEDLPSDNHGMEDKNVDHSSVSFVSEAVQKIKSDFKRFV